MFITIDENKYELKKMTPNAVATIANILGRLSVDGRKYLTASIGGKNAQDSFMWGVLAVVTGEDLIKFIAALTGFSPEFINENFNLAWVFEAVTVQMQQSGIGAVMTNFMSSYSPNQE